MDCGLEECLVRLEDHPVVDLEFFIQVQPKLSHSTLPRSIGTWSTFHPVNKSPTTRLFKANVGLELRQ